MNNYKTLKIKSRISKLDNIILNEPIDLVILNKLINSDLLQSVNNPMTQYYYESEKEQLIKYIDIINNGYASVYYQRSKKIKFGRVLPLKGLGLFSFRRAIRHTLSLNTFEDIDIYCAHQTILLEICEYNKIDCKYIKQYVNNREYYLTETMEIYKISKDEAKNLFIILLYFGNFTNWKKEKKIDGKPTTFITKFSSEIKNIGKIIYDNNIELVEQIKKNNNKKNILGSVLSYYLQEL
jgi:hypothetical protein